MPVVKSPTVVQTGPQRKGYILWVIFNSTTLSFSASIELLCALCTVLTRGPALLSCLVGVLAGRDSHNKINESDFQAALGHVADDDVETRIQGL